MQIEEARHTFVEESTELLRDMEQALLELERAPGDGELINRIFRAAHTIKGSGGMFGFERVVAFAHKAENLLDRVRRGEADVNPARVAALLEARDHLARLIEAAMAGDETGHLDEIGDGIVARLGGDASARFQEPEKIASPRWHISLRPGPELLRNGMDPLAVIRYLSTLGTIEQLLVVDDALPPSFDVFDPERLYIGFEVELASGRSQEEIAGAFDFIRESSTVVLLPPHAGLAEFAAALERLPEPLERLVELLVVSGALTQQESIALVRQLSTRTAAGPASTPGELPAESGNLRRDAAEQAFARPNAAREGARETKYLRIQAEKLDALINLVGELVIAGAAAQLKAQQTRDASSVEAMAAVTHLVEQIRDSTLKLRMVQIGETFNRFQRVVHDLSAELGKCIELVVCGADTELDKGVVEKIGDPLTHLVRNAVDHGIESAELRATRHKPDVGRVELNAYHDSGSIVIEVSDDGGGINRGRLLAKARDLGLVPAHLTPPDVDIDNLIFHPGLSTAGSVTNVSGRGVGMDVVRRNVEALRGTVDVISRPEEGTTLRIRLPLTLAIIEGFLLRVGESYYVVPLDLVEECMEFSGARQSGGDRDLINLRGEVLPFIRLREWFHLRGSGGRRENVVVVQFGGRKAGLVVDELLGEYQTVLKPLGGIFEHVRGLAGSTILGNGRVALILDVPALVARVTAAEERKTQQAAHALAVA